MMHLAPGALAGSYTPVITPFRDGEVDQGVYEALVERQIVGGSQGVVVNGTTGEPSTLTAEERADLVRVAVRCSGGRVPVVAATGSQSHAETVWLCERAVADGADALLVVTPYYVRPPQRGLVEYFVDLCRRSDLPLLAYHIPGRAAVTMEAVTLEAISERAENFVGMKHASSDLALVSEALLRLGQEFRIFVGLEELSYPMLALGASGLMNAVANLVPERVAALWHAVEEGRLADARKLHFDLWGLNRAIFWDTNPIPIKYMLARMGVLERNEHRLPMVPAAPDVQARLDAVLEQAGLTLT
ncbi:MAG: 4-hydroxy-tetrahydrodipicolinate synthase [Acidimicrobiales bacterium]